MLNANGLSCERGDRQLFAGLSLALEAGGLARLLGANGSGKTSLLRILAGLTRPAAGEVRWRGERIGDLAEEYGRELAYIGHAPALKDELTVAENLAFAARLAGIVASGAQLEAALEVLGMATRAALPARVLSQGQKRRVSLARLALPGAPALWLLDEPFAALDEDGIGRVRALTEAHLARGGMLVLTSHQDVPVAAGSIQTVTLGA
ncbi:MAG: cytochrome c biogenesis heme-transporting ATPase CcmA [Betaproteobacteria bacterium]|nr:cytochrome c biogenesis heme-transporting ATPase CcmA [Betaproteobacteria bacterium]